MHGGILSLTDSHHYHRGQKPTLVGIGQGGNKLGDDGDDDGDDDDDDHDGGGEVQIWHIVDRLFAWSKSRTKPPVVPGRQKGTG